ncbi:glycosyltransferase family 4 protein [Frigidibacter sp. RF13]|uniref:glycosyltransferase family 4 protein n=1 Tax=Frigidibacter sp. RF13 TaxID=2997340 RepID=UPI00226FD5B2|nr:glycosyltransferase family 4 protein [Frigidibacter sp. RF13]MCY1128078.1 glycosyltransferase family 4 protein [Frigidibacter sp. RF13]
MLIQPPPQSGTSALGLSRIRPVRALMSMPCADVGVGNTCRSLMRAAAALGYEVDLHTSRSDSRSEAGFPLHSFISGPLAHLPHRITRRYSVPRAHRAYLQTLRPGDIAYLWPSVPWRIFAELRARDVIVVTEAINTLMRHAKPILDAEYDRLGLPPTHRITDTRIADEEARLALTDAIFSPSPATDRSLAALGGSLRVLPASYGTELRQTLRLCPNKQPGAPVRFLFVGLSCIRKGLQDLLAAWRDLPANAHLRIVGLRERELQRLYSDVLQMPNVSATGFATDIAAEYSAADVFVLPSLEEGDPRVTYEAAAAGLPILASPFGAGRIGADTGAVVAFDTRDIAQLRDRIAAFTADVDLRRHWGERAFAAVRSYGWTDVAERRFSALGETFGSTA